VIPQSDSLLELAGSDHGLLLLIVAIGFLLGLVIAFALATIILRIRNRRKAKHWECLEREWRPLVLDALTESRPREDLWRTIDEDERLYFVDFLTRYARRLRGREREIIAELARPFLSGIVLRLRHGDPEQRARAVWTLGLLDLSTYAGHVREALDDPSDLVALLATRALTGTGNPDVAEAVLTRLHRFAEWRPNFIGSLLANVGTGFAPALRGLLANLDEPCQVRLAAAEALRQLNDVPSGSIAERIVRSETDRDLVAGALRLLARVGQGEHLTAIRELTFAEDPVVRAQAVSALGRLGGGQEIPRLREALDDPFSWVALHAARALREVGGVEVLRGLADSPHRRVDFIRQALMGA
jgi:hypothetical protein